MFTLILTIIHPYGASIATVPGFADTDKAISAGDKWQADNRTAGVTCTFIVADTTPKPVPYDI